MSSINPIVLFGDVGPDVVTLSQIYDPDNDEYVLSSDRKVWDTSKLYYTRSYSNKIVTFTKVIGPTSGDNPHELGWYEQNAAVKEQKGKYVPAPKSLVVVDQGTDDWAARTILIVESVDETTLKSTLVPHNCGTDGETSARALDYGNDRFMLYNTPVGDTYGNIQLLPDRKLTLYGKHYYMYELRKGGQVISSQTKIPNDSTNALIPFISATARTVTITATNYGEYTGKVFDVPTGFSLRRLTIPAVPEEGDSAVLPTLDAVYKDITSPTSTRTYVVVDGDGTKHTETTNVIRPYFLKNADDSYTYLEPGTEEEYLYGKFGLSTDVKLNKETGYFTYDLEQLASTTIFQASGTYYRKKTDVDGCVSYAKLTLLPATSADPTTTSDYVKVGKTVASKAFDVFAAGTTRAWRPALKGTSDEVGQGKKDYYLGMSASSLVIPFYERVAGNVIAEGQPVGTYNKNGTITTVAVSNICNLVEDLFGSEGVEGYVDFEDSKNHVYYPDACYLKQSTTLVAGEPIVMNVFELLDDSRRQVMTTTLFVKDSDVGSNVASTKKIASFDAEIDTPEVTVDADGAWLVGVGSSVAALVPKMKPVVLYDDGSEKVVPVDNISCYVYGIDSISTANIGKDYTILFKYFPEKAAPGNGEFHLTTDTVFQGGKIYYTKNAAGVYHEATVVIGDPVTANTYYEYLSKGMSTQMTSNAPKRFLSCKKTIRIANTADVIIRKISIFPVWDPVISSYHFKYALYTADMTTPPEIVDDYGSVITALNDTQVTTANMMYMDDSKVVRPSTDPSGNFGYIQHGTIAVYAQATGYMNAIYTQPLAVRLQNWMFNSLPIKWLIGDDTSKYDEANMPYGNGNTDLRPYIQYDSITAGAESEPKPYRIGVKFVEKAAAEGKDECFLRCFYYAANPPAPLTGDPDPVAGTPVTPTDFRIRAYTGKTYYEKLGTDSDDEKAVRDVVYYTEYGKQVTVIPGVTKVHDYIIKAQAELEYYTKSGDTYTKVTGDARPVAGTILSNEQRYSWYLKREEEIVTEAYKVANWKELTFALDGAQTAESITGGSIPTIQGSNYNQQCMGNVVVEFLHVEGGTTKYLYGVPVETRHPYKLTLDETYKAGVDYYEYEGPTTNLFKKLEVGKDYEVGDTIDTSTRAKYIKY